MTGLKLHQKKCIPCEGGEPPLTREQATKLLAELPDGWELADDGKSITKEFQLQNFRQAIDFINKAAKIAEAEGHHPDIHLHDWNKITLTHATHAIRGLSENDFILAAKIEKQVVPTL